MNTCDICGKCIEVGIEFEEGSTYCARCCDDRYDDDSKLDDVLEILK